MKYLIVTSILLLFTGCGTEKFKYGQERAGTNRPLVQNEVTDTSQLNTLDLSNQGLGKIPEYVFGQTNIEVLNVSGNSLTGSLQSEIRHLKNIRVLDLSKNNMTGLPAEIGQLKLLEMLDVSNNNLTGLPHELGNLSRLKTLNISGNKYSEQDLAIILENLPDTVVVVR